jgi:hypothetical protein
VWASDDDVPAATSKQIAPEAQVWPEVGTQHPLEHSSGSWLTEFPPSVSGMLNWQSEFLPQLPYWQLVAAQHLLVEAKSQPCPAAVQLPQFPALPQLFWDVSATQQVFDGFMVSHS